jgi:hypothetical protein
VVHGHEAAHDNRHDLLAGERVAQALLEHDGEGDALTELVGTGGRAGGLRDVDE